VRIAAYLLVILMVGLGGLEPPTSPLISLAADAERLDLQRVGSEVANQNKYAIFPT
jgi:hypothetical protein